MKTFFKKLWNFLVRHRWSAILILLSVAIGGFFVWDSYTAQNGGTFTDIIIPKKEPETVQAPLSGREINFEQSKKRPIAVVIENHQDARPQAGLNEADFVFETLAEGGITRFLAIFQSAEPKELGPVRSARSYFVEWADAYDALFAHVGGSKEALSLIKSIGIDDLNQFYFGGYFWRDSRRYAPHNVYTTLDKLRSAAKSKNMAVEKEDIPSYKFKEDELGSERPIANKFTVNFNYSFSPTYTYDPKFNAYKRSILGVAQLDANSKKPILAKNVVVAFSNLYSQKIRSTTYTMIDTTASGAAYYYIDGVKKTGTWSRASDRPIKFYDAAGKEIEFNIGTTWVDFVAKGTVVK